jgi:pimeloyl-ACP methyl ester carboxylesterase
VVEDRLSQVVISHDRTPIAVYSSGSGPPLVLVHGASADHTTWRVSGPLLARQFTVHAIDRRGRGASGDAGSYSVEREFEDVAAVAEALAEPERGRVPIVGHSFGGRVALGAALLTRAIQRLVVYEGAPAPPGDAYQRPGLIGRLRGLLAADDPDAALATFMADVVGMPPADLAAYRADPIWPRRASAAHTIVRELEAEGAPAAGLDALGAVAIPVLQILGGESAPVFVAATQALDERLARGQVVVLPGQRHSAHHTDPVSFVRAVTRFVSG